ncbi:hypothetical protein ACV566_04415 [Staphylococcus aureus]
MVLKLNPSGNYWSTIVNIGTIAEHMQLLNRRVRYSAQRPVDLMKVIAQASIKALNQKFLANISKEIIVTTVFAISIYAT